MMKQSVESADDRPVLPPRSQPNLPTRGSLTLSIRAIRLQNGDKIIGRVKMWGEATHNFIHLNDPLQYAVKCRVAPFMNYLRDAKSIKLELVDRRNNELIGCSELALLLYLPNPPYTSDRPLDFSETLPIMKHPTKVKIGELEFSLSLDFSSRIAPQKRGADNVVVEQPILSLNIANQLLANAATFKPEPPVGPISQVNPIIKPIDSRTRLDYLKEATIEQQPLRRKKSPLPIQIVNVPTLKQNSKDLQCQLLRLKLEAESILCTESTTEASSQQSSEEAVIRLQKLSLPKCQQAVIRIHYPALEGGRVLGKVEDYTCTINSKLRGEVFAPNRPLVLKRWSKLASYPLRIEVETKKGSSGKCSAEVLLGRLRDMEDIELEGKAGRKLGRLSLVATFEGSEELRPASKAATQQPTPSTGAKLLYVCIASCELFSSVLQSHLYKIAFKLGGQRFESGSRPPNRPLNFDVVCPVVGKLEDFLCLELWRSAAVDSLQAVGKLSLEGINLHLQRIDTASIGAAVIADSKTTLNTLADANVIGYLDVQVYIGTPQQINWQRLQQQKAIPERHQSGQPIITRQTERTVPQENTTEREKRLQTQQAEDKHEDLRYQEGVNLAETISRFFQVLSDQPAKTTALINNLSSSSQLQQAEFARQLQPFIEGNDQELPQILCSFFGEGSLTIDVSQFLKCFSSYANFIEILQEERTALLQRMLAELDKSATTLDVFEERLLKHSQFGCLSKPKFKEILKQYGCKDKLAEMLCGSQNILEVAALLNDLKSVKFLRKPQHIPISTATFQQLVKQSVEDVLVTVEEGVALARLQAHQTNYLMGMRSVAEFLESFKVEVSYWEALLLVETIKSSYKQDLNLPQGIINSQTLFGWVGGVVESHAASVKSAENSRLNRNVESSSSQSHIAIQDERNIVLPARSEKEKSVTDEILNIADLLKFKDKMVDYTESSAMRSKQMQPPITQNQSKYSNILPAESHIRGESQSRQTNVVKVPNRHLQQTVPPLPAIMRFLKCEIIEVKVEGASDLIDNVVLEVELTNTRQLLIDCRQDPPLFYGTKVLYEQINLADMNNYSRNGVSGLGLLLKTDSGRTLCRGLVTLENIFELNRQSEEVVKKTCLMYPRNVGKVVVGLSLVRQQQQPQLGHLQKLYVTVLKLQLRKATDAPSTFTLQVADSNIAVAAARKPCQVEFDSYSSKLVVGMQTAELPSLRAEVSLEGCVTHDDLTMELPVVDAREQFHGTILLRLSTKQTREQPHLNNPRQPISLNLHLFPECFIVLGDNNRLTRELYFSLYRNGRQLARTSPFLLTLDKLTCVQLDELVLTVQGYSTDEVIELRTMTASDNLTYGISRISLALGNGRMQFGRDCFCLVENKDKLTMRIGFSWAAIEEDASLKLGSIPKMFNRQHQKLVGSATDNTQLKSILHDKAGYSYSEISYVFENLSAADLKRLTEPAEDIAKESAVQFAQEAEFSDPERAGFVGKQQLERLKTLFNRKDIVGNGFSDGLTKQRVSVDYLPYLRYTTAPIQRDSTLNQVCGQIDRVYRSINKKLQVSHQ